MVGGIERQRRGRISTGCPAGLPCLPTREEEGEPAGLLDAHCRPKLSFSDSEKYFKSARYSIPIFSDDQRLLNLEANVATY